MSKKSEDSFDSFAAEKQKEARKNSEAEKNFNSFSSKAYRNGSYAFLIGIIVFVILILANLIVRSLPAKNKLIDMSGNLTFDVSKMTVETLADVDKDINIIVLKDENLDTRIETFLGKYEKASSHINVNYYDLVKNPSMLDRYGVTAACIVVECPETGKNKVVQFTDIIKREADQAAYQQTGQVVYVEKEFDGENQLTNAILNVTNDIPRKAYYTTGHNETEPGTQFTYLLEQMDMSLESISLIGGGSVPEDCDVLFLYSPTVDIAEAEEKSILEYMEAGGNVCIFIGGNSDPMVHIKDLMANYGMVLEDGYYSDFTYAASQQDYHYMFNPVNGEADSVKDMSKQITLLIYPRALSLGDVRSSVTITSILESGQSLLDGGKEYASYYPALEAVETVNGATSKMMVFTCPEFLNDQILTQYGKTIANADIFSAEISTCLPGVTNVSIPAKSIEQKFNTVSGSTTGGKIMLIAGIVFAGIAPLILLVVGFITWLRRRRK